MLQKRFIMCLVLFVVLGSVVSGVCAKKVSSVSDHPTYSYTMVNKTRFMVHGEVTGTCLECSYAYYDQKFFLLPSMEEFTNLMDFDFIGMDTNFYRVSAFRVNGKGHHVDFESYTSHIIKGEDGPQVFELCWNPQQGGWINNFTYSKTHCELLPEN